MTDLLELAARCENEHPSYGLNEAICKAIAGPDGNYAYRDYVNLIDAAMTLVPEGWDVQLRGHFSEPCETQLAIVSDEAWLNERPEGQLIQGDAKTLPLALCAASLKAMARPLKAGTPTTTREGRTMTDLVRRLRQLRGKFTPGPWTFWEDDCDNCKKHGDRNLFIDGPEHTEHGGYSKEADAELIALAPEIAAALEQSTLEIKEYREALDRLIVAIEFEVPAIRDGVDTEERLRILMECATEARAALNHHEGSER